jgi:hypothetical protein
VLCRSVTSSAFQTIVPYTCTETSDPRTSILKTENCDHSKRRYLFRTQHVVHYVASFLAGGGLCGAGGRAANGCGEGGTGGCLFDCNFSVKRSTVLTEAERRTRPDIMPH